MMSSILMCSGAWILPAGQRIEAGEIQADGRTAAVFTVVGHKRICRFAPVCAKQVTVCITASRAAPALRLLAVYQEKSKEFLQRRPCKGPGWYGIILVRGQNGCPVRP